MHDESLKKINGCLARPSLVEKAYAKVGGRIQSTGGCRKIPEVKFNLLYVVTKRVHVQVVRKNRVLRSPFPSLARPALCETPRSQRRTLVDGWLSGIPFEALES